MIPGPPRPGPGSPQDEETAALLRAALRREAEAIHPTTGGLERILRAARSEPTEPTGPASSRPLRAARSEPTEPTSPASGRPRPLARWLPVLAAATIAAIVGVSLGLARLGMITTLGLDAVIGRSTPVAGPGRPGPARPLPVYLVERRNQRWALVREFSPTTLTDPTQRLHAALRLTITGRGTDPGHTSAWRAAGLPVKAADDITVTTGPGGPVIRLPAALLGPAPGPGPAEVTSPPSAQLAVQQLIWTVTATTQDMAPVRVEGPVAGSVLFGTLALDRRFDRDENAAGRHPPGRAAGARELTTRF